MKLLNECNPNGNIIYMFHIFFVASLFIIYGVLTREEVYEKVLKDENEKKTFRNGFSILFIALGVSVFLFHGYKLYSCY